MDWATMSAGKLKLAMPKSRRKMNGAEKTRGATK
jgi:hypothetical protein